MERTNVNMMIRTGLAASAAISCALTLGACCSHKTTQQAAAPPPAPRPVTYGYAEPVRVADNRTVVRHPPAGSTGIIQLEEILPVQVAAGKDFTGELKVTNLTDARLEGVVLTNKPGDSFKVTSSTPEAESSAGAMVWNVGKLDARETKSFKIMGRSDVAGPLQNCASVTYTPGAAACATLQVVKAELAISSEVAERYSKCDPIPYKVTVKNTGVGAATNVVIRQDLPEGLVGPDNRRTVEQTIGTLAQGESKTVTFNLKAERGGTYTLASNVGIADGPSAATKNTITVGEPMLQVKVNAPAKDFVNADIPCEVVVTNTGDYPAMNTTLQFSSDARGATVTAAESGGTKGSVANQWSLGTIEPKQSRTVKANIRSSSPGTVRAAFTVNAQCAKQASASAQTELRGIPALLLEVVDQNDPVRIGADTVYTITVTNQGSEPATNIKIVCKLEDAVRLSTAQGATNSDAKAGAMIVNFAPLAKLAPGEKAVWRVTVQGQKEADTRFGVEMTSAELDRPVEETESTTIYSP